MSEEQLPVAVWSGEIMGVQVHVLDDGRRIVDSASFNRVVGNLMGDIANGEEDDDFDPIAFAEAFAKFMRGEPVPQGGTADE